MRTGLAKGLAVVALLATVGVAAGCAAQMPVALEASRTVLAQGQQTLLHCVVPEGPDEVTYKWSDDAGVIEGAAGSANWSCDSPGDYTITVRTKDENGARGKATIRITVTDNYPPFIKEITVIPDEIKYLKGHRVLKGHNYELECVVRDEDGDELDHSWTCDGGELSAQSGSTVIWTAPPRGGEVTVTVTVNDGKGGLATESLTFDVKTCACSFK